MSDLRNAGTIAAIATPPGTGGIGVVRVSGPEAKAIAARLFRSLNADFSDFIPRHMHHGQVLDREGRVLDDCLAVFMPGPNSYTGEDVIELHCHGGRTVTRLVLEAVLAAGAAPAGPGEFTKRAFLSGRIDLAQAEAVAELITAPSRVGLDMARAKLAGGLSEKIRGLRNRLEALKAGVCLAIDFPDDEIECLPPGEFAEGVAGAITEVRGLIADYGRAKPWREGLLAVLAGRVNAGKSSLMNAFLGRERAIVAELPGTTRDYLEEALDLSGLPVRLIDTAGLRDAGDAVELAGVKRSRELIERADLVLLVMDASLPAGDMDARLPRELGPEKVLVVLNKADLPLAEPDPGEDFRDQGFETVRISAKTGRGLDELSERIRERAPGGFAEPGAEAAVPNLRQAEALTAALDELTALECEAAQGLPYDLLSVRLDTACAHLSGITGEIAPNDVLNSVFEKFCIGK